jgi:hypothetical protein
MKDQFLGEVINARITGQRPFEQMRQLFAVTLGQMPPGNANLLFYLVEVIE